MDREEPSLWSALWCVGICLIGLAVIISGLLAWPPSAEGLTVVDHIGSPTTDSEIIQSHFSRRSSSYRAQYIWISTASQGTRRVSPPPTLWVHDLDQLRPDQPVRFLINPSTDLVYEATTNGRVLLSYEESARHDRESSFGKLFFGFCLLSLGVWHSRPLWARTA